QARQLRMKAAVRVDRKPVAVQLGLADGVVHLALEEVVADAVGVLQNGSVDREEPLPEAPTVLGACGPIREPGGREPVVEAMVTDGGRKERICPESPLPLLVEESGELRPRGLGGRGGRRERSRERRGRAKERRDEQFAEGFSHAVLDARIWRRI